MNKKILCSIVVIAVCLITFSYIKYDRENVLKIGIMNDQNIEYYDQYFNTNNITKMNVEFKMIASDMAEYDDAFLYTLEDIRNGFMKNRYDMIIGIEEDYILTLPNSIFLELNDFLNEEEVSKSTSKTCITKGREDIYYLPSSIDNNRLLIINNDIFNNLNVEIPKNQLSMDEFINLSYRLNEKIKLYDLKNHYAVSMGSPIDEYLSDDISKLLIPLKESEKNNEMYVSYNLKLSNLAKHTSYNREQIGHQLPLDFAFKNGSIAMKVCTLYELYNFINSNKELQEQNYKIESFNVTILPLPYINNDFNYTNANVKVMAINKNTKHIEECKQIISYFMGKEHALNTLNFTNPFVNNIISLPIYTDDEINNLLYERFKFNEFYYGNNLTTFYFKKNYTTYWDEIKNNKTMMDKFLSDSISINTLETYLRNSLSNEN